MTNDTPIPSVIQINLTQDRFTVIDLADSELAQLPWYAHVNSKGVHYVRRNRNTPQGQRTLFLHRAIMERVLGRGLEDEEKVDHINRLPWDNRRSNLRLLTISLNNRNKSPDPSNKSGYKGVCWNKDKQAWVANIRLEDRFVYLGAFQEILDAAKAYDAALDLYFPGIDLYRNFPSSSVAAEYTVVSVIEKHSSVSGQKRGKGTSQYLGVSWFKRDACWKAFIYVDKKQKHLGYYQSEIDAARAYNVAALKYHGEFARLNIIN